MLHEHSNPPFAVSVHVPSFKQGFSEHPVAAKSFQWCHCTGHLRSKLLSWSSKKFACPNLFGINSQCIQLDIHTRPCMKHQSTCLCTSLHFHMGFESTATLRKKKEKRGKNLIFAAQGLWVHFFIFSENKCCKNTTNMFHNLFLLSARGTNKCRLFHHLCMCHHFCKALHHTVHLQQAQQTCLRLQFELKILCWERSEKKVMFSTFAWNKSYLLSGRRNRMCTFHLRIHKVQRIPLCPSACCCICNCIPSSRTELLQRAV